MFRSPLTDSIVVIIILLLIVGPKKLPQLGRGLGDGMREFKEGITGDHKSDEHAQSLTQAQTVPTAGADDRPSPTTPRDAGADRS